MAVITVSRLYGIGGRQFGLRLARDLGYDYFDKELLGMLSARLGQKEEHITLYEEMDYGPPKSLLEFLSRKYPGTDRDLLGTGAYGEAVREILRELAARGRVVIVGRGGQAVLADLPGVLHLRLVADEGYIVHRLVHSPGLRGCGEAEIAKRVRHNSKLREKFIRTHFDIDWADPLHYHLVINLGRVSPPASVRLVTSLVREFETAG